MNYDQATDTVFCHIENVRRLIDPNTIWVANGNPDWREWNVECICCGAHLGYVKDVPKWITSDGDSGESETHG